MSQIPNPGSDEALAQGCQCPVIDNAHGRGYMGGIRDQGELVFWTTETCPLHGGEGHVEVKETA